MVTGVLLASVSSFTNRDKCLPNPAIPLLNIERKQDFNEIFVLTFRATLKSKVLGQIPSVSAFIVLKSSSNISSFMQLTVDTSKVPSTVLGTEYGIKQERQAACFHSANFLSASFHGGDHTICQFPPCASAGHCLEFLPASFPFMQITCLFLETSSSPSSSLQSFNFI